ncbi:MAG: hypothetical protein JXR25_09075 [Pontiellaceae bacterium]|nr:hypothetical protein [Pontiellaceae bacterium]MBN2784968.1 hypothetical protein [Pontiellaceae bacterium]
MSRMQYHGMALAAGLMLASGATAAPQIDLCIPANATPSQFDLVVRTTEPAGTWVEVYADAAGTTSLSGSVGMERSPIQTGDPAISTNYYQRADQRALRSAANDKGLALHRISGCEPMTTYYYRVHATNSTGSAVWPTNGLLSVSTELENDFVLESRQLLIQLDPTAFLPTTDGAIGVLTAAGASGPIASFVGDGVSGAELYFDLSSLFSASSHVNMANNGLPEFEVTLYGPASHPELTASFSVGYSNAVEVAMANVGMMADYEFIVLDIRSIAGLSQPPPGVYTNTYGTVVSCMVTNTFTSDGTTEHSFAGWTLTGIDTSSGTGSVVSITLTNNMLLTWEWNTRYWLDTGSGSYGLVDEPDQWVDAGDVVTITGLPDMFYHVDEWTGDVVGTTATNNQIQVPMDRPRSIFALFAENFDANGVPQRWFYDQGFTNTWETAGLLDHDHDGMLTWEEWVAGTSPTNASEVLLLLMEKDVGTGGMVLAWPSVSGRVYKVWRATSLTEGFYQISGNLNATPPFNIFREPAAPAGQPVFYRISVEQK